MRLSVFALCLVSAFTFSWPSLAAERGWWLEQSGDGTSIDFYDSATDDRNDESYVATLACDRLELIADDGTTSAAQAIVSAEWSDQSLIRFNGNGASASSGVSKMTIGGDDMFGGWDLTVEWLTQMQLAPLAKSGPFTVTIGKTDFDLTPRDADRGALATFLANCR